MQYHSNPDEMLAASKARHEAWLREAALLRQVAEFQPTRQPLTTRIAAKVQKMTHASKQRWQQARTIFKLAPVE